MFECFLLNSLKNLVLLMFFAVDSVVTGCICCHCKQLVSKLQRFKCIDDACSLMGMVTAFGQQLKEKPSEFFNFSSICLVLESQL